MISGQRNQLGVTLLEVLLVLAIGMGILFMSIQQYISYSRDSELRQLKYNVDALFVAAALYYRSHCSYRSVTDPSVINDLAKPSLSGTLGVSYQTLIDEGYLQPLNVSPLVDNNAANPYYIQFNNQMDMAGNMPQRQQTLSAGGSAATGTMIIWRIQISATLKNTISPQIVLTTLAGNCLSTPSTDQNGKAVVLPCYQASGPSNIVAWERLPSMASDVREYTSPLWGVMPLTKQFNQMYTTYPINILLVPNNVFSNTQYYTCGG